MKLATLVVLVIGLAGCTNQDDNLDRERLVPQGMRRTTVTIDDLHAQAAPSAAEPAEPAPMVAADEDSMSMTPAVGDSGWAGEPGPAAELAPPDDPQTAQDLASSPEPASPAAGSKPDAASAGAFVVQAGAYKQSATADALAARLQAAGIAARVEPVTTAAGTLHRVVVPGFADRESAQALVARLKQELGVDAAVRTP